MTRRALRIATILFIIQSLIFFPAPVSLAEESPTQAEVILAQEVSELFMKRLYETGDFSIVIDEMYAEDFIERYVQEQISEGKESDSPSNIFFEPGFKIKRDLLKQATVEDWRRLYIAVNNLSFHLLINGLNKHAEDILNGRAMDDEKAGNCVPSKVIELFNSHPILKGSLGLDDGKPGESSPAEDIQSGSATEETQSGSAEEESEPKSIETPEEMRDVTETLQEGLRLLLEEQGDHSPRLTETAKSAFEVVRLKLKEKNLLDPMVDVSDKKYLGLPAGTRVLNVTTPIGCWLEIAQVNGKHKIVQAQFILHD
jgi:hypothetical protein